MTKKTIESLGKFKKNGIALNAFFKDEYNRQMQNARKYQVSDEKEWRFRARDGYTKRGGKRVSFESLWKATTKSAENEIYEFARFDRTVYRLKWVSDAIERWRVLGEFDKIKRVMGLNYSGGRSPQTQVALPYRCNTVKVVVNVLAGARPEGGWEKTIDELGKLHTSLKDRKQILADALKGLKKISKEQAFEIVAQNISFGGDHLSPSRVRNMYFYPFKHRKKDLTRYFPYTLPLVDTD